MGADKDELIKATVPLLRAVLAAQAKDGIPLHKLMYEFQETVLEPLKFREMGYGSLEQFLLDMSDICVLRPSKDGVTVVKGIASKEDAHVYKLVGQQKSTKKRQKRMLISKSRVTRKAVDYKNGFVRAKPLAQQGYSQYSGRNVVLPQTLLRHFPLPTRPSYPFSGLVKTPLLPDPMPKGAVPIQLGISVPSPVQGPIVRQMPYLENSGQNISISLDRVRGSDFKGKQQPTWKPKPAYEVPPRMKHLYQRQDDQDKRCEKGLMQTIHQSVVVVSSDDDESSTSSDNGALECKLRELLKKRPNGLWATRLQPEFKECYDEKLPANILDIIRKQFSHFIRIDCPLPNREILYLKEEGINPVSPVSPGGTDPLVKELPVSKPYDTEKVLKSTPISSFSGSSALPSDSSAMKTSTRSGSPLTSDSRRSPVIVAPALQSEPLKIEDMSLPEPGTRLQVYIAHIDNLSRFYVHFADSEISKLVDRMQEYYQSHQANVLTVNEPKIGEFYSCRYCKDQLWFRAKVLSVKEQRNSLNQSYRCHVFYVDYGNDEYVLSAEMKPLLADFCKLPAQAARCVMDNMVPVNGEVWPDAVSKHFASLTEDKELTMSVKGKEGPSLYVDLFGEQGQSIQEYLVSKGVARKSEEDASEHAPNASSGGQMQRLADSPPPSLPSSASERLLSSRHQGIPPAFSHESCHEMRWTEIPTSEDFYDVFVVNVNSTSDLSIILIGAEHDEMLNKLEADLTKHCVSNPTALCAVPEIGKCYAGLCKGCWVRVVVLSRDEDEYKVHLVDRGSEEYLPLDALKELPYSLLQLSFQAIPCSLANVPPCYDQEVLQYLTDSTVDKQLVACVIERPSSPRGKYLIEIYDTSSSEDLNINQEIVSLIEKGKHLEPQIPPVGGQCQAYITFISPEGHFFIQILGGGLEKLELLMKDMAEHFTRATRANEIVSRPKPGMLCCAKYKADGVWYRAQVVEVNREERMAKVKFVDYGNTETIPLLLIRKTSAVSDKVVTLPHQAVECELADFDQLRWDQDVYARLLDFSNTFDLVNVTVTKSCTKDSLTQVKIFIPAENSGDDSMNLTSRFFDLNFSLNGTLGDSSDCPKDVIVLEKEMAKLHQTTAARNGSETLNLTPAVSDSVNNTTFENISIHKGDTSKNTTLREWDVIDSDSSVSTFSNDELNFKNGKSYLAEKSKINGIFYIGDASNRNVAGGMNDGALSTSADKLRSTSQSMSRLDATLGQHAGKDGTSIISSRSTGSLYSALFDLEVQGIPRQRINSTVIDGYVSHAVSPDKFSFMLIGLWEKLESMHFRMHDFYEARPPEDLTFPVGVVVAAFHTGTWYRAIVMSAPNDGQVAVKFPDFSSDFEIVPTENLRSLDAQFKQLPFFSHRASLAGVRPLPQEATWSDACLDRFLELAVNRSFIVNIAPDSLNSYPSQPLLVDLTGEMPNGRRYNMRERLLRDKLVAESQDGSR